MAAYSLTVGVEPFVSDMRVDVGAPDWTITVQLYNDSESEVGFKALTNSPRRWSVRPNGGVVAPHGQLEVVLTALTANQVSLSADRHLILTTPLTPDEATQLRELRAKNVKSSLELLSPDNAAVSQARLTPRLLSPAPLSPIGEQTSAS